MSLAQLAEYLTLNQNGVGSNPTGRIDFRLGLSSPEFTLEEIRSKDRSVNQEKNVIL